MKSPVVFLDRDGTLNPDPHGYINDPDDFELFPDVPQALRELKNAGFLLVVVTNQSGIGRKTVQVENVCKIHDKLQRLLQPVGVSIDRFFICPHHPDERCACRKPAPGLIFMAMKEMDIDPGTSFLIGDKDSDAQMALAANVFPILIGKGPRAALPQVPVVDSFRGAADLILKKELP